MVSDSNSTGQSTSELQENLFRPDVERESGDRGIWGLGFDIHPVVFPTALLIIGVFVVTTLILGEQATSIYPGIRGFFEGNFGWLFLLSVNLFIVVLAYFALSRYRKITLGDVEAEKELSDSSWVAMLFSAGMGIGLMFYNISEPLYYFSNIPSFFGAETGSGGAGITAMTQTLFHWRFHPWVICGLVGLGSAFFSFNRGLPLTFRSVFWLLLGEWIYGWPGYLIDLVTVFVTLFGLATSPGLGIAQINTELSYILGGSMLGILNVPSDAGMRIVLITVITLTATASIAAGLEGGIRHLNMVNVLLMFMLLAFVLTAGMTMSVFGTWVQGPRNYFSDFLSFMFFTGTLGDGTSTVNVWTVLYWAWWIAWSPFVEMFVAHISKGRTVREFVSGVFALPSLLSTVWFSASGESALLNSSQGNDAVLATYNGASQTVIMFALLEQPPFSAVSGLLTMTLIITFLVIPSDPGSLVVDHLTSGSKHNVPRTQRIFRVVTEDLVASPPLCDEDLGALRATVIATGPLFAVVLVVMCYTVYLDPNEEYELLQSEGFAERTEDLADEDIDIGTGRPQTSIVTNIRQNPGTMDNRPWSHRTDDSYPLYTPPSPRDYREE